MNEMWKRDADELYQAFNSYSVDKATLVRILATVLLISTFYLSNIKLFFIFILAPEMANKSNWRGFFEEIWHSFIAKNNQWVDHGRRLSADRQRDRLVAPSDLPCHESARKGRSPTERLYWWPLPAGWNAFGNNLHTKQQVKNLTKLYFYFIFCNFNCHSIISFSLFYYYHLICAL